ncbi:MAG: FHA domain-containing protein [Planctomycetota bacterium]
MNLSLGELDMVRVRLLLAGSEKRLRVRSGAAIVGRSESSDIQLNHASISRRHCVIISNATEVKVVDLCSRKGTAINSRRLRFGEGRAIRHQDTLQIGKLRFEGVEEVPAPAHRFEEIADSAAEIVDELDEMLTKKRATGLLSPLVPVEESSGDSAAMEDARSDATEDFQSDSMASQSFSEFKTGVGASAAMSALQKIRRSKGSS